jgi:hypothetical protein
MRPFQIDFSGVLPEPALAELSRAMYRKVTSQYGLQASCHVSLSCSNEARPNSAGSEPAKTRICARVHIASETVSASAESSHPNAVRAMRSAFEQACMEVESRGPAREPPLVRTRPSSQYASRLLLLGRSCRSTPVDVRAESGPSSVRLERPYASWKRELNPPKPRLRAAASR